jgi:hypothetical protein
MPTYHRVTLYLPYLPQTIQEPSGRPSTSRACPTPRTGPPSCATLRPGARSEAARLPSPPLAHPSGPCRTSGQYSSTGIRCLIKRPTWLTSHQNAFTLSACSTTSTSAWDTCTAGGCVRACVVVGGWMGGAGAHGRACKDSTCGVRLQAASVAPAWRDAAVANLLPLPNCLCIHPCPITCPASLRLPPPAPPRLAPFPPSPADTPL